MTKDMIPELEKIGVDVCGENGEFHTLVVNCPLFNKRITGNRGEKQEHEGYWFLELT